MEISKANGNNTQIQSPITTPERTVQQLLGQNPTKSTELVTPKESIMDAAKRLDKMAPAAGNNGAENARGSSKPPALPKRNSSEESVDFKTVSTTSCNACGKSLPDGVRQCFSCGSTDIVKVWKTVEIKASTGTQGSTSTP